MAERRKPASKSRSARSGGGRVPSRKKTPAAPVVKRRSSRRAAKKRSRSASTSRRITATKRTTAAKRTASKKTSFRRVRAKKATAKKTVAKTTSAKKTAAKKAAAKKAATKKAAARRPAAPRRPTRAQLAAVIQARAAFETLAPPRSYTRLAVEFVYIGRRTVLVSAFRQAGFSEASIRSRLGWITRRRNKLRVDISEIRKKHLAEGVKTPGLRELTGALHGKYEDDRRVLKNMYRKNDPRFLAFMNEMKQLGLDHAEAMNEWFSPKIK